MHPFLNIAIQAARASSRIILRFMDQLEHVQVTEKNRNDLVTEVDKLSEMEIIGHIQKAYPHHAILAEESGFTGKADDYCWVIDPLDGTRNFVHGFPQFAISIAVKRKEQVEIGCIYDPIRQELFTATRGKGAHLNNRRLRVSKSQKLENALIGTGFPCINTALMPKYLEVFSNVLPKVADIRRAGAAALDLAYVAAGRLDGFWEADLAEWDMSAGALMIQEAGGIATDFSGDSHYLQRGHIVAGNPLIHAALLPIVAQ